MTDLDQFRAELAAARVIALSPAELVRRLDRRFQVLAGGRRGAVERHATLRAAIDWSYELLGAAEQRLLARVAVFSGGCTLEAVEEICSGDPVEREAALYCRGGDKHGRSDLLRTRQHTRWRTTSNIDPKLLTGPITLG